MLSQWLRATAAPNYGFNPNSCPLQPQSQAGTEFAPPVTPWVGSCLTWPKFCECGPTPFSPPGRYCRSSCPEYAQGELPFTPLNVPLPVTSPANAGLAVKAVTAATQTPTANFLRMSYLPPWSCRGFGASRRVIPNLGFRKHAY